MPRSTRISFYFNAMTLVLSLSFMAVIGVLVWREVGVHRLKERSNDFHLATIEQTFRIKESLFELEKRAAARHSGEDSALASSEDASTGATDTSLHLGRSLHVIGTAIATIRDLQQAFGGSEFEKTLKRIEAYYGALSRFLSHQRLLAKSDRSDFVASIGAFRLFLSQLERLHSIAHAEARHVQEANAISASAVFVPLVVVMIVLGVATFRYVTVQAGLAFRQLQRAESELRLLNAELEQRVEARTAELRAVQEELVRKERLAALGQLTATVSHELRNPMGTMKNAVAAIKKLTAGKDERLTASLRLVDRSIGRCDAIIGDLLDYTRVSAPELTLTALDDWLKGVLDEYEFPSSVRLEVDLNTGARLAIDRQRFHRAMFNLLDNACHAMAENEDGGKPAKDESEENIMHVSSRLSDGVWEVSIADTGPGIPAGDSDKIFEPLFSTKNFGVGLGLAMVKQIVDQHSGEITVSSRADQGAEFTLRLPLQEVRRSVAS